MSVNKDSGGPAFPGPDQEKTYVNVHEGMSLRDYFAAKVVGSVICMTLTREGEWDADAAAVCAYDVADAMLKARAM